MVSGAACLCPAIREYMHRHADVPLRGIHKVLETDGQTGVQRAVYNGYTEIFRSSLETAGAGLTGSFPERERYNTDSGMKGPCSSTFVLSISRRTGRQQVWTCW